MLRLTSRIDFNRCNVGESAAEQADATRVIARLSAERNQQQAALDRLRCEQDKAPPHFTREVGLKHAFACFNPTSQRRNSMNIRS